jgi:hypothetical protein
MHKLSLLLAAGILFAAPIASAQEAANGRNVVFVTYSGNGMIGAFRQTATGAWKEQNGQGQSDFRETNRDDWSVYLESATPGKNIQLDLHTKRVNYSDAANRTSRQLYTVTGARPWSNGRRVTRVIASSGVAELEYVQVAAGRWIERALPSNRTTFQFRESNRDDWSVYLVDDSRKVEIQLDLHTRKVNYSEKGGPRRPIYTITLAVD